MNLYPSNLSRDAALESLPAAAWMQNYRTFAEFTSELDRLLPLSEQNAKYRQLAQDIGRYALLARAMRVDPDQLERVASSENALKSAGTLIASWKGASLRPEDIRDVAKELEANAEIRRVGGITGRLARLYELYELELGRNWTDREADERALLRRLEACEKIPVRLLKPGESVELHGFHKLPYVQFRIIEKLKRLGHPVIVRTPIYASAAGRNKYPNLIASFGSAPEFSEPESSAPKTVSRTEAPSPYAEVYEIGRRVRRWITDDNIAPDSIGVVFRDLGAYSQAVHDVFKRLEVPFYERRGEPAQFQPLVRVALSAIDACVAGLDRRSVFRFICAGPVDVAALAGTPHAKIDPDALQALALKAGIDRTYGTSSDDAVAMWTTKLRNSVTASAPTRAAKPSKRERDADALIVIIERMNAMRTGRSVFAHVESWRTFFETCGLSTAGKSSADTDKHDCVRLKDRLALNALQAALNKVAAIPNAATDEVSIDLFSELLNTAIQEESIRADGLERGGVRVLNFYDVRGLTFKRLVIGGLGEGMTPARAGGDPLLGQGGDVELRKALGARVNSRNAAAYLAPRLSHEIEEEERALFDGAVASAQERLLLSRPKTGFDGKALGASEYWDEFNGAVESSMPIHPAPVLSDCITPEEVELRAAWVLGGGEGRGESRAALRAFETLPRMKPLAHSAAIERSRYQYFLDQALNAAQLEKNGEPKRPDSAGIFDGIVAEMTGGASASTGIEAEVARRLAPNGIGDPMLGPSDLEKLAACPFRFFLERVCRFDESEEPGQEVSPLDVGNTWHSILNDFYKEELDRATKAGELTAKLDRKLRSRYLDRLLSLAGEALFKTATKKFTGHPGFWQLQEERLRETLGSWLDCELQESDGFYPACVEFDFGPEAVAGIPELKVPLHATESIATVPMVRIKGRMDRLDLKIEKVQGQDTVVAVRVVDYKLSRGKKHSDKTKVETMSALLAAQLPIYLAAAVEYLFKLRDEQKIAIDFERVWTESRGGYYGLRDTFLSSRGVGSRLIEVKAWPLGTLREFLNSSAPEGSGALFDLTRQHVNRILSGRFPVLPLDCGGLYCAARYACRYQAIQAMDEEE